MNTPLLLLSMFLGVVLTVHLAMNGMVGGRDGDWHHSHEAMREARS